MRQGSFGDCWMLAALASTLMEQPGYLPVHYRVTGAGPVPKVTVTPYVEGKPVDVTVYGNVLTTHHGGGTYYVGATSPFLNIYEKALAKLLGGYRGLNGGWPQFAISLLTGSNAVSDGITTAQAKTDLADHNPVTAYLRAGQALAGIVQDHAYAVVSIHAGTAVLQNPWGGEGSRVRVKVADLRSRFSLQG